jgi:hypothetical protein
MLRVYVAGPIRARNNWEVEQNIRRAEGWALEIIRAGAAPHCPHTQDRHFIGVMPEEHFLKQDLAWLEVSDAIFMVGDWRRSAGSVGEYEFARENDIPIFEDFGALCAWIQVEKEHEQDQTPSA